ncbi:hypothetical protein GH714_003630 [Hevea brasiliensis]|uniref:SAP domain-containing protein n=1 Tax=Hevea brasiliensis TaxID=3981 RepID=A0A6A6LV29_HEVBR|nr:hypothetical protein GH714_003630 [Hevea brasiliensis]
MSLPSPFAPPPFKSHSFPSRNAVVYVAATSTVGRKSRRKKQQQQQQQQQQLKKNDDYGLPAVVSAAEKGLRFSFMEELMERARNCDAIGVSDVIYDMVAAGLSPGPRSFHGLIVAYSLSGNLEGARLRDPCCNGELNYDIRLAWIVLVEELVKNKYLEDANKVFLKGAKGGLRATDELYDCLIEEDCKVGDHSNALEIAYEMEAAGRMATTFHFNCLLSVQATCGIPEIAFATFENMEYGEEYMKPDTETYNWVIQAYTRAESYDRVQDVAELLGMMVEDHKRLQPNVRTYALLVECFTKYCVVREAIRHFRALRNFEGGTKVLHNDGNFGDPLSLHLRALCREGRVVELLEALEAMARDNQPIPPRAMILSRKYRTLVSSWIEPLQEEAELGYEIDYVARYIAEGGLTGERKRWVPRRGKAPLDPDAVGFIYSNPMETSFKQRCWRIGRRTIERVEERLKKIIKGPDQNVLKPKAASKMIVSELKEELEAQGLPTDGTRNVLYQRVQKARRINRSRGRPLWVPPVEEEEEEVDEELDELISRIKLQEGNTEFWKRRFLGEGLNGNHVKPVNMGKSELPDVLDDVDAVEDAEKVVEEEEADDEEEVEVEVEQTESQDRDRIVKDKEVEAKKPLQMIGVQLLKDSDQTITRSRKSKRRSARASVEDDDDDDWFPEDIVEAFRELRKRKIFDVEDMYTIADAWGWTWEREIKNRPPRKWSQEWEVELAIEVMLKVIELGGTPTIGDCAMILSSAIRAPMPSAFLKILQTTHSLGYAFGSPLYDEVITLCIDLGELDAAIAIVADLETAGITVPDQTLDKDEQPEVQGPAALVSSERGATGSPVEYSDVSAYRLSLSEDTKALNQLNLLIQEGKGMASVLYTYRSCVKALPQLPDSMKHSQADLYMETYQVLDLEMSRLREIQRWQASAASKLAADMQRFSRPERRINGPTITHLWSMLKLLDVLVQLDHLKNAKASIPNDFSWYKRTFTQVSVQWQDIDSMREELDDLQIFLSTRWAILLNLHVEMFRVNNVEDILQVLIVFAVESLELDFALLFPERHILLRVLPVLVVLATSSEKDGESLYKRVKINRLINIFKNDPVIPAFPDLHLSPAAILKELAMYFQKFSSQTRLLTLPAPHEFPPREAQEYP